MLRLLAMLATAAAVVWIASDPPGALRSLGLGEWATGGRDGVERGVEERASRIARGAVEAADHLARIAGLNRERGSDPAPDRAGDPGPEIGRADPGSDRGAPPPQPVEPAGASVEERRVVSPAAFAAAPEPGDSTPESVGGDARVAPLSAAQAQAVRCRLDEVMARVGSARARGTRP